MTAARLAPPVLTFHSCRAGNKPSSCYVRDREYLHSYHDLLEACQDVDFTHLQQPLGAHPGQYQNSTLLVYTLANWPEDRWRGAVGSLACAFLEARAADPPVDQRHDTPRLATVLQLAEGAELRDFLDAYVPLAQSLRTGRWMPFAELLDLYQTSKDLFADHDLQIASDALQLYLSQSAVALHYRQHVRPTVSLRVHALRKVLANQETHGLCGNTCLMATLPMTTVVDNLAFVVTVMARTPQPPRFGVARDRSFLLHSGSPAVFHPSTGYVIARLLHRLLVDGASLDDGTLLSLHLLVHLLGMMGRFPHRGAGKVLERTLWSVAATNVGAVWGDIHGFHFMFG